MYTRRMRFRILVEPASPGYMDFGVHLIIILLRTVCVTSFSTRNLHLSAIWILQVIELSTCFLMNVCVTSSST